MDSYRGSSSTMYLRPKGQKNSPTRLYVPPVVQRFNPVEEARCLEPHNSAKSILTWFSSSRYKARQVVAFHNLPSH